MLVLGIETSCDECSCALVRDGREIIAHVTATQTDVHRPYKGVVPEMAARRHIEAILPVFEQTRSIAEGRGFVLADVDGIGVTSRPGLSGSLAVGLGFAKGLALALDCPFVGINHLLAHFYAPHMEFDISYPYLGLLVSGGHTVIAKVTGYDSVTIMGASIDDACGEAFDKVARHYGLGYPGGKLVDELAQQGDSRAFNFPFANLRKRGQNYDVSYSGLKNAVINQADMFWDKHSEQSLENICASFQRVAIDSLLRKLDHAVIDSELRTIVVGGGVAANSYLRRALESREGYQVYFPPFELCTDNAAMVAGIACHYLGDGQMDGMDCGVAARVQEFRHQ